MAFSSIINNAQTQNAIFAALQQQQAAQDRANAQKGPSATLPNGTHIQCGPGQILQTFGESASCTPPMDVFTPSWGQ